MKILVLILAIPCSLTVTTARADDTPPSRCVDAYTGAQTLRNDRKLLDARAALRICAQPTCKDFIVKGCTDWLAQVAAALPSVVPVATDASGNDLRGVKVSMDGNVLLEKIDGRSVDVDPGTHTFAFEASDGTKAEKQVVVAEGEKDKRVAVTLVSAVAATPAPTAAAPSEPAPASSGPPWKTIGLVTAGVGIVGLGLGTVFGLEASGYNTGSCSGSPPVCTAPGLSSAQSQGNLSTVFFVAGGILAAGGVTMWLLAPSGTSVQAGPTALNGGGGVAIKGVW